MKTGILKVLLICVMGISCSSNHPLLTETRREIWVEYTNAYLEKPLFEMKFTLIENDEEPKPVVEFDELFSMAKTLDRKVYNGPSANEICIRAYKGSENVTLSSWHLMFNPAQTKVTQDGAFDPKDSPSETKEYTKFLAVWNRYQDFLSRNYGIQFNFHKSK